MEDEEKSCDTCLNAHTSYESHPYGSTTATETIFECFSDLQEVEDGAYWEDNGKDCPGWQSKRDSDEARAEMEREKQIEELYKSLTVMW